MRRIACMFAVLAVGGIGLLGCNKEEAKTDNRTPGEKVGSAVDATTQKAAEAGKAAAEVARSAATQAAAVVSPTGATGVKGLRNALEGVVENALNRNNWGDMVSYFNKADQERLSKTKPETSDLDALVDQFKKQWHDKYNDSFRVMDSDKVFADDFVKVSAASAAGDSRTQTSALMIAASHGLPELNITAIEEGGLWKLDVPDTIDGKQLHDNLLNALKELTNDPSSWPSDKNDAYRAVSHRILAAVMNRT